MPLPVFPHLQKSIYLCHTDATPDTTIGHACIAGVNSILEDDTGVGDAIHLKLARRRLELGGHHIRPCLTAPESWHLPVGLSLSQEIGYQRRKFAEDSWTYELRPIIDKKVGRWYFDFIGV